VTVSIYFGILLFVKSISLKEFCVKSKPTFNTIMSWFNKISTQTGYVFLTLLGALTAQATAQQVHITGRFGVGGCDDAIGFDLTGDNGAVAGPFNQNIFDRVRLESVSASGFAICGCIRGLSCQQGNVRLENSIGQCIGSTSQSGQVLDFDKIGFGSACF